MPNGIDNRTRGIMEAAVKEAEMELKGYPDIPEHYETISRAPNMKMEGIFSEIDLDIERRLKRCDTFVKNKDILDRGLYEHVRKNIIEGTRHTLRNKIESISRRHRVLTRAARICKDETAKQALLKDAEALKNRPEVRDYNLLLDGLEAYAGMGDRKVSLECSKTFDRVLGYKVYGGTAHGASDKARKRPAKITVEMDSMDDVLERYKISHPGAKGKTAEELKHYMPTGEMFGKVAPVFAKDACKDVLESYVGSISDSLDVIIIDGKTLREVIEQKDQLGKLTKEQIEDIACNYVAAALKSESRVETFVPLELSTPKVYYSEPVPITVSAPKERITLSLWEQWMSHLGFYKEKVKLYNEQLQREKRSEAAMKACRQRVRAMGVVPKDAPKDKKPPFIFSPDHEEKQADAERRIEKVFGKNQDEFVAAYIEDVRRYEIAETNRVHLLHSFFPDEAEGFKLENETTNVKLQRDLPLVYAAYLMGKDGNYSLEQIMDLKAYPLTEERKKIGEQLKKSIATMTQAEFDKMHFECREYYVNQMKPFAERMASKIKDSKTLHKNYTELTLVGNMMCEAGMESFLTGDKTVRQQYGEKKFDDLNRALDKCTSIKNSFDTHEIVIGQYHKFMSGDTLALEAMVKRKIHEKSILTGLKNKEPGLYLSTNDVAFIQVTLPFNPEYQNFESSVEKGNEEVIRALFTTGGEGTMKIDIDKSEVTLTALDGELKTNLILTINGKENVEMKELDELQAGMGK